MATGTAQPKAVKDVLICEPQELVLDRSWNGRWQAVNSEGPAIAASNNLPTDAQSARTIRDLANSIKQHGQLEDVLVCKRPPGDDPDGLNRIYHVVAGMSRTRAFLLLTSEEPKEDYKIRCRVITVADDKQAFLINEEENRERNNLSMLDKAYCMSREKALDMTANEIAARWGVTVQAVSQALSLIEAPPEVQQAVADRIVTGTDVIDSMKKLTPEQQIEIVNTGRAARAKNLTFKSSHVKEMARKFISAAPATPATPTAPATDGTTPATDKTTANGAPAPAKRGRKPSPDKKIQRGVADLRNALKGREGVISSALLRYFDGFVDMDDAALVALLDAYEYEDSEKTTVSDPETSVDELEPRTEGNDEARPVDGE